MEQETLPSTQQPRINDVGFSLLHDPGDAIIDIVFIHGLQGHPRKTWTWENTSSNEPYGSRDAVGSSHHTIKKFFSRRYKDELKNTHNFGADEVFWPLDLLPSDCINARILTWGYDSKISHFFNGPANQSNITGHAKNLLHALKISRQEPYIYSTFSWWYHREGRENHGKVLRRAATDTDPAILHIYTSTEGILFLGTPHRGSNKASIAEVIRKIVSVSGFDTVGQNIRALRVDSAELELIHELFMKLYDQKDRHFKVLTFQEAKGMAGVSYLKLNERVVEPFSSSITTIETTQIINANHMSMCRFSSKDDEGYKQVLGEIQILILGVQKKMEEAVREKERAFANFKSRPPSQTTIASSPYSFNDVERQCIALLTRHTTNVAEYKSSLPTPIEGTCRWIFSQPQYRDWNLQKETCLLWISGYPGSGKTILSAYLLEYLTAGEFSPSLRTTSCYFFCDEKIITQRDSLSILRSLIHQLLGRRRLLVKYVKAAYDFHGPQFDQNFNELWRLFVDIASDRRVGPISVIIDAIDECEETTRERFLQDVMNLIDRSRSIGSRTPHIKFIITSRPLLGRQYATNLPQIDLTQDHVERDLRLVIQTKVEGIVQRTGCKPEVRTYLENALYSRADRTFLWVTLVLHLLEKSFLASQKDFRHIIDEFPRTLTTTYERFLYEISTEYQSLAIRLLHFLVGSSRPLNLEEMRILIAMQSHHCSLAAVEEDAQPNVQATIEGVLGPLVRIWEGRIYLVHQSLKEFLQTLATQTENPLSNTYGIDPRRANLLLAEICVSYLLLDDFKQDVFLKDHSYAENSPISPAVVSTDVGSVEQSWDPFDLEEDSLFKDSVVLEAEAYEFAAIKYPFFDYSARYWAEHFSLGFPISSSKLQQSVILLLDARNFQGFNWLRFYWFHSEISQSCPRDFDPIVAACYFGYIALLKSLMRVSPPIESEIGIHGLYWASRMGHRNVVDLLLRENIQPDVKVLDGQSAFIAAVSFNRLDVVKILLEDDGFISEQNGYRVNYTSLGGRTPLSIAAGNGFVEIVKQLLQHSRILPDLADSDYWTPLFWSVSGKHLDVLRLLVTDCRVSINHVDRSGRSALSWAASAGELELVKYLLSLEDLKADETDRNGRTALSWAAGNGHFQTTIFMRRSQRIDLSRRDKDGRNALSWACAGGYNKVVEYLIKHDREGVDKEDVDGWAPLAWALFSQAPKTVQVLINSGLVDVNKKDSNGRSALSFAAGYGYLDVVKLLVTAKGIDIESKDNDGRTPLSYATRYPDIIRILQQPRE